GSNCPDAKTILERHNWYRARHQTPALQWDAEMAAEATAYAHVLARRDCILAHSMGMDGENLVTKRGYPSIDSTCILAPTAWYREVMYYNFDAKRLFKDNWYQSQMVGHFTQLVWRSTTLIGCGVAVNYSHPIEFNMRTYIGACKMVVCRYRWAGNIPSDNVFAVNGKWPVMFTSLLQAFSLICSTACLPDWKSHYWSR
ncbi:hypothetical protein VOLCADRAFT_55219, partial [Volvox carteri f. nagariensis]